MGLQKYRRVLPASLLDVHFMTSEDTQYFVVLEYVFTYTI